MLRTPRLRLAAALCLGAVLAAGCATASAVRLAATEYPPRPDDHPIAVYDTLDDVRGRPWIKVGRVVGEGSDSAAFAAIVAAMQREARRLGADALVLTGGGLLPRDGDGERLGGRAVTGLCLRWQ
ncbi:MAG: hypothetical protein AB7O97_08875 [Planctomycetota bacterium]